MQYPLENSFHFFPYTILYFGYGRFLQGIEEKFGILVKNGILLQCNARGCCTGLETLSRSFKSKETEGGRRLILIWSITN